MLLNLPKLCQLKVLRFLDEVTLMKVRRSSKGLNSTIENNRLYLIRKNYDYVEVYFKYPKNSTKNSVNAYCSLKIGNGYITNGISTPLPQKTIYIFNHKSVKARSFKRGSYEDITQEAEIMDDERVYTVMPSKKHLDIRIFTNDVLRSLEKRMTVEFQNSHIEALSLQSASTSTEIVESLMKCGQLRITKLTLDDLISDQRDLPLVSLLRTVAAQKLVVNFGTQSNTNTIFNREFIEFLPSLQLCNCNRKSYLSGEPEEEEREIDISAVAPLTVLPHSRYISIDNLRKIMQNWYNGRFPLKMLDLSTLRMSILDLVASLDVPHTLLDDGKEVSIVNRTGERCTIKRLILGDLTIYWRIKSDKERFYFCY